MKSLFDAIAAKPLLVALTGSASGFTAWLVAHAETIEAVFRLIGGFFGCLLAVVSFVFVLPRCGRFIRAWLRRGFFRADVE